jgi:hypothetical protein
VSSPKGYQPRARSSRPREPQPFERLVDHDAVAEGRGDSFVVHIDALLGLLARQDLDEGVVVDLLATGSRPGRRWISMATEASGATL